MTPLERVLSLSLVIVFIVAIGVAVYLHLTFNSKEEVDEVYYIDRELPFNNFFSEYEANQEALKLNKKAAKLHKIKFSLLQKYLETT